MPELIRIERNNGYNTFSGYNNLLRLRDASNWTVCTRLGLKPAGTNNFYYTDLFNNAAKYLCIVYYPKEEPNIKLSIFPEFYPCEKSKLTEKIKETVRSLYKNIPIKKEI